MKSFFALQLFCFASAGAIKEPLSLDYQGITYHPLNDSITVTINFSGQYSFFDFQTFSKDDIVQNNSASAIVALPNKIFDVDLMTLSISLRPKFFRIVAMESAFIVSSDSNSMEKYYRFLRRGISTWTVPPNSVVKIPIPSTPCQQLYVLWPKLLNHTGEHCKCLRHETEVYSFGDCVAVCGTDYNIELDGDSITFREFNASDTLVHFLCEEVLSGPGYYQFESIIASYRLQTPSLEDCEVSNVTGFRPATITLAVLSLILLILVFAPYTFFAVNRLKKWATYKNHPKPADGQKYSELLEDRQTCNQSKTRSRLRTV